MRGIPLHEEKDGKQCMMPSESDSLEPHHMRVTTGQANYSSIEGQTKQRQE